MKQDKIGNYIKKLRENRNWTQQQLADEMHVTRQCISKWERNLGFPDIDSLKCLSTIFDIKIDDILEGNEIILEKKLKFCNILEI